MNNTPEKRTAKRNLFTVTVAYAILTDNMPDDCCTKGHGITTNISNKGIGLIMNSPVEEGQCIALYGEKLASELLTGSVRWCSKISEDIYRTGLKLN